MDLKKYLAAILLILLFSIGYSQEKQEQKENPLPASIYLAKFSFQDYSFEKSITDRLNIKDFKFLIIDKKDLEDNFFTINTGNLEKTASKFAYESYKNTFLYKYHFRGYDLRNLPWLYTEN